MKLTNREESLIVRVWEVVNKNPDLTKGDIEEYYHLVLKVLNQKTPDNVERKID